MNPNDPGADELLAAYTTVATEADAERLAEAAVQAGLAACVQIEAVRSVYRWQGRIERAPEQRLLFKTHRSRWPALRDWLLREHPYTLPALYAVPVALSTPAYTDWVGEQLAP